MANNMETELKKLLTSLLTSTPLTSTMSQLARDYQNTIGEPIPYHRLGYNNLDHFLRSIPDTVQVKGYGPQAEVIPIIQKKSAHVNVLVSHQKINKPKTRPGRGRNSFGRRPTVPPPRRQTINFNVKRQESGASTLPPRKMYYPNTPDSYSSKSSSGSSPSFEYITNKAQPSNDDDCMNLVGFVKNLKISVDKVKIEGDKKVDRVEEPKVPEEKIAKEKRRSASPKATVSQRKPAYAVSQQKQGVIPKHLPATKTFPKKFGSEVKQLNAVEENIPYNVRNNLKNLISQFPEGIWCAEVPKVYRRMYGHDLNYQEMGFRSLIDLCVYLSSIFHYVRPGTEDFKLYDRSRPLPQCAETSFTVASYSVNKKDMEQTALPNLDWEELIHYLPDHIFKREIPRAFIPRDVEEGDNLDVVVGEIYDPSKFWVYLRDSHLDNLMDEMQDFYREHAHDYALRDQFIQEGLYCVHIIFGEYHRALIVNTMPETKDTIRVVFIDYGTMSKISTKGLCFLHVDFAKLPAQAIRCRLANILPPEEGVPWSHEAIKAFRKLVAKRDVTAKISVVNWEDQVLEVYLADVTEEDIFFINDRLIQEGLAVSPDQERKKALVDPIYTPKVKFIHLFPTFLELEYGVAPSTTEMDVFHDCNIPINFCYPQYFDIDCKSEETVIADAERFHENNCLKGRRSATARFYDLDALKNVKLDLSIFGELESEITEFLEHVPNHKYVLNNDEDFADAFEEEARVGDKLSEVTTLEHDIKSIHDKVSVLSAKEEETVNKLRNDFMLTESIMKDLNTICCNENTSSENDRNEFQTCGGDSLVVEDGMRYTELGERELWTISEARESVDSSNSTILRDSFENTNSDANADALLIDHPLNTPFEREYCHDSEQGDLKVQDSEVLLIDRPISDMDFVKDQDTHVFDRLSLENVEFLEMDFESERGSGSSSHAGSCLVSDNDMAISECNLTEADAMSKSKNPTNPFLNESEELSDMSLSVDVSKLNPNNPFLTFLSSANDKDSDSSSSTAYESFSNMAKTKNSWENYQDLSPETISLLGRSLCSNSNSSRSVKKTTMSTQTSDGEAEASRSFQSRSYQTPCQPPAPPCPPPSPPCPPPVPPYSHNNWSLGYTNPHIYNARFTANVHNFSYQQTSYDSMRPSYRLPPPPGFAPIYPPQSAPHFGSSFAAMGMPMGGNYGPRGPPFAGPTFIPNGSRPYWPSPAPYFDPSMQNQVPYRAPSVPLPPQQPPDGSMTSLQGSVGGEGKDFYAVYNEQLRKLIVNDAVAQDGKQ